MEKISLTIKKIVLAVLTAVILSIPVTGTAQGPSLDSGMMPYPFWVPPRPGDIYHVPTGLKISFEGMMDALAGSRVVYIGESHTNIHAHRVQIEILQELEKRFPGQIALGMEMFRRPQQESLDRWTAGELPERAFIKESRWYENWQSDFAYYRDILLFARDKGMDIVALNPPRELQRHIGMGAKGPLPESLQAQIPEMDSSDRYQREVMEAIFSGHDGGRNMFNPFLRIQTLWEETMASQIVKYLQSDSGRDRKMVVLAGGMHVEYGFGIPKKVMRRLPLPYSVVLSSATHIPEEKREEVLMDVEVPRIPLLIGDFLLMIPYEDLEGSQVRLGIIMEAQEDRVVVKQVIDGSAAEGAGILAGDWIRGLDGEPVGEMVDVILMVKTKRRGDTLSVSLRRGEEELTLKASFPLEVEESDVK